MINNLRCVAVNNAGERQSSSKLSVLETPVIEGNYFNEHTVEAREKLLLGELIGPDKLTTLVGGNSHKQFFGSVQNGH